MGRAVKLRPYQLAAVDAIRERYRAGDRSTLLVLPTGCGKTVVFAEVARRTVERPGQRVLVLAHRTELLTQAQAKLRAAGVWAELEQAKQRAGMAQVVVASVQTLRGKRLEEFDPNAFAVIVVDEAHHATAKGYRAVLDHFARARVLGVTATPDRADGTALGNVFQSCAYRYEIRQAIADGYLSPLVARRVVVEGVDLGQVRTRAGDLAADQLAEVMAAEEALHGVAIPLLDQAGTRPTIAFAVDVEHAHRLAEVLNRYQPGVARAVDGSASAEERAGVLEAFRQGTFRVLVNCALFIEGFDEPSIACVAIARPTKSRALYTQMVGRGTRLADGKADCLVLDFTGQAGRHRLVGPVDVLAGEGLDDDVRAEVEARLAEGQLELDGVLEAAQAEVERQRAASTVTARAKYFAEDLDPFLGEMPELDMHESWSREPPTPQQRKALAKAGIEPPEGFTKADASRVIETLHLRRLRGLCTYKQARALARHVDDAQSLTFEEATAAILRLKRGGWRYMAAEEGDAA